MRSKIQLSLFLTLLIIGVQGKYAYSYASPTFDFSYSGVCVKSPTTFTVDYVLPDINDITAWNWNFGDGKFSTFQNPAHTYQGSGTFPVTLKITDIYGNISILKKNITIQDLPVAFFSFDTPNCSNSTIQFTDLSNPTDGYIQKWIWNFNDGSPPVTVVSPDDPNVKHTFPNDGTFNVSLTVINSVNSCEDNAFLPVTVLPGPLANFHFTGKCEDQAITFTDASSANGAGNIVSWSWDFGDPTSGIPNLSNLKNPSHVFANSGIYTVRLIVTNFNSCIDTIDKQVFINSHSAIGFSNTTPCLKELVFFTPDPAVINVATIATWHWDFGDAVTSNTQNQGHSFVVSGNYPVTLKITDLLGCENQLTKIVVVDPLPVSQFSTSLSNCAGAKVNFLNQSSSLIGYINKWHWDFGDGNSITINHPDIPDVSHVYALPQTYSVKLTVTASNGCSNTSTQVITIKPNPIANFGFSPACKGTPTVFNDLTQINGSGSIVDWDWNFGDPGSGTNNTSILQNPEHDFKATGTSLVQFMVKAGNGCSDTVTYPVFVNPPPTVNFTTSNTCQNSAVIFNPDASAMNISTVASWLWEFGSGVTSMSQNPTPVFLLAGTYPVSLTIVDTAGCTNTITRLVTIAHEPIVNFSFPQPACIQSSVQFDNFSTVPGGGFIVSSEWDFGDGHTQTLTSLASVSHTYSTYSAFSVKLTVTTNDGCKKTLSLPIVILPQPLANFSFQSTCQNSPVQFTDLSQPGAGLITKWSWEFGEPGLGISNESTAKSPAHTYNSSATFPVTLIVSNSGGCLDTIVKQVPVHGLPAVDFTSAPGCVNELTHFVNSPFVNAGAIASYYWNFGDGHTTFGIDPAHNYSVSGTFTVSLTITDTSGCISSKTHSVVIAVPPSALFEISAQTCTNNPMFFTVLPSPSGGAIASYYWDFGDGQDTLINSPATGSVSHSYAAGGNYKAILTVKTSQGCQASSQHTFKIATGPVARFNYDNSCAGSGVNFTDASQVNSGLAVVSWSWNFDDAGSFANNTSNLRNPNHIFTAPGTYNVLLQVGNASGCSDTISHTIIIKPKPTVDFSWAGSCVGSSTKFTTNPSVTNIAAVASYQWDFGDGSSRNSLPDPVHSYAVTGNYSATLTIVNSSGCKNSIEHTVNILPQPNALFSSNNSCIGASTQFTDQSFTTNGTDVTAWHWDFGENSTTIDTSDQQNPSWVYKNKGVYQVQLRITSLNGCENTITLPSQVFGNPVANFTYNASPCDNGTVYFQDSSFSKQALIVGYKWEFESNHFSTSQNPTYIYYATDSCYNVRLIARDVRGCIDTVVKEVCVPSEFDFSFTATNACLLDSTYFTPQQVGYSTGKLVSFIWNFGDPISGTSNTSTAKLPLHYFSRPGQYTISLSAKDVNGCSKTVYRDINILALPVSYFTYTQGVCDSSVYFNESSFSTGSAIRQWTWDFGDGVKETIVAPGLADITHKYLDAGSYSVSLTVTNSAGCSTSIVASDILVKPCITADFKVIDTLICQNNRLSFTDNSNSTIPANEWYWDFGDGSHIKYAVYASRVTHVFKSAGTFKVKLVISSSYGGRKVSDTATLNVLVNATPLPDFIFGTVCHEQNAVFTNMTSGNGTKITSYNWSFGEPKSNELDTSSLKNPVHLFNAPGTYDIKLKVKNALGCKDSVMKSLTVYGLPDANYAYSVSCAGNKTAFSDLSIGAVAPIVEWDWTFFDEASIAGKSDKKNTEFIYNTPGEYLVNLKVTDEFGCVDTINQHITTWSVPKSLFTYTNNYDNVQGKLQLENYSVDATKYYWDFGDGKDSYAENPVALYQNEGTFNITLVARNDKNCSDTMSMKYEFMVKGLYIPNAFSPTNMKTEVQFLKPVGINLIEYRFEVFDRWGNLIWWTDKLDPDGRPLEGWDGKYKGILMPEGAYPWRAFGIFKDGSIWESINIGNNDNLPQYKVGTATMIN